MVFFPRIYIYYALNKHCSGKNTHEFEYLPKSISYPSSCTEAQAKLNERKTVISEDVSTKLIERADAAIAQAKEDVENGYFSDSMNEKFTNLQEARPAQPSAYGIFHTCTLLPHAHERF